MSDFEAILSSFEQNRAKWNDFEQSCRAILSDLVLLQSCTDFEYLNVLKNYELIVLIDFQSFANVFAILEKRALGGFEITLAHESKVDTPKGYSTKRGATTQ